MLKKSIAVLALIFIFLFIVNIIRYYTNKSNVALIKIHGIITESKAQNWIENIDSASKNSIYKAIFIDINSPGGSANASEKLYLSVKKASKSKPVVALINSIGASGAYYAACGADKIVAYPTSVVGSIGVLFETLNISGLAQKIGVSSFVIKSGKVKDVGNPLREPTKADRQMLQNVVNGIYEQFLGDVAKSRHIKTDVLKKYADGSVFSAKEALKIGLIDKIGTKSTARNIIKQMTGIHVVHFETLEKSKGLLENLIGSKLSFFLDYIKFKLAASAKAIFYD